MKYLNRVLLCCYKTDKDSDVQEMHHALNFLSAFPILGIAVQLVFLVISTGAALYQLENAQGQQVERDQGTQEKVAKEVYARTYSSRTCWRRRGQ